MKVGQKVLLQFKRLPEQVYTVVYIGPYSVKLMDNNGKIHIMKKSKVRYRLYGPPKDSKRADSSVDTISIPIGGQPASSKK